MLKYWAFRFSDKIQSAKTAHVVTMHCIKFEIWKEVAFAFHRMYDLKFFIQILSFQVFQGWQVYINMELDLP